MDFYDIEELFKDNNKFIEELKEKHGADYFAKYIKKTWVKVPDASNTDYSIPIAYNTKKIRDKITAFHDGYILVNIAIKTV